MLAGWAVYQLGLGVTLPQVDNRAHLGGLLRGALLGLILHPTVLEGRDAVNARQSSKAGLAMAAFALIATAMNLVPRLLG
jgi:membrane associated rhomboid family serine protease